MTLWRYCEESIRAGDCFVAFDATGGDSRLVLTREQVVEMFRVFVPAQANEARITDQIETNLNRIADLGFIRKLKSQPGSGQLPAYEVRRILKQSRRGGVQRAQPSFLCESYGQRGDFDSTLPNNRRTNITVRLR